MESEELEEHSGLACESRMVGPWREWEWEWECEGREQGRIIRSHGKIAMFGDVTM